MEKNINIKSLLKRVGSLLTAYVLVLGSFSAVVPFLFAQRVGAETPAAKFLQVSPDSTSDAREAQNIDVAKLFTVSALAKAADVDAVTITNSVTSIEAKINSTNTTGKIILAPADNDCSSSSLDWDAAGKSTSHKFDVYDTATVSFCYRDAKATGCGNALNFAYLPNDTDEGKLTKDVSVAVVRGTSELVAPINTAEEISGQEVTLLWKEAYDAAIETPSQYAVQVYNEDGKIFTTVGPRTGTTFFALVQKYNIDGENFKDNVVPDGDYTWCIKANGSHDSPWSPARRFTINSGAPKIKLIGEAKIDIPFGTEYTDTGAIASEGAVDITTSITTKGKVVSYKLGKQSIMYEVSGSGGKIARVARTVNVVPGKITIKVKDVQKIYGEDDPEFKVVITPNGLLEGDKLKDILKDNLAERQIGEEVGIYQVTFISSSDSSNPNYEIIFEPGNLEIIAKKVKVIVDSHTKIDGEENPVFTYKIVDENGKTVDDDKIIVKINRLAGEEVGEYELKASAEDNRNYIIDVSHQGVLEIVKKPAQVAVIPAAIARATPTTYYDRVGVATADEPEKEETKKVEEKKDSDKKEEVKKQTWKIFGFAWYWWGLAILAVGALRWWFGGASLAGGGKDTTNSSDK